MTCVMMTFDGYVFRFTYKYRFRPHPLSCCGCGLKQTVSCRSPRAYRLLYQSSLGFDGVDGLEDLLAHGVGQRSGACSGGSGLLAFVADHVGEPGLDELGGVGILAEEFS